MRYETAGDPMTGLLWTKKTRSKISNELAEVGIVVSPTTVGKILKDLKYSLKCNSKKVASGGQKLTKEERKAADDQFEYIAKMRKRFSKKDLPILSPSYSHRGYYKSTRCTRTKVSESTRVSVFAMPVKKPHGCFGGCPVCG